MESNDGTATTVSSSGDGGGGGGGGAGGGSAAGLSGGGAGLASMVELQEQEITGLKEELSEALSKVPRGGGEDGGVSSLEEALKNQV